jgi:hypothetical protein
MTVKLLNTWGSNPAGSLYTSTPATEAAMIANGTAVADITGATAWPPAVPGSTAEGQAPSSYPSAALAARPIIGSFGDSTQSQDLPNGLLGDTNGVSPMFWTNALMLNAFDLLDTTKTQSITPSGGTQTTAQNYQCGVWGYSGGQLRQALRFTVDQYIARLVADTPGRTRYVLQSAGLNDLGNDDSAGADVGMFEAWREIIEKQRAAGIVPVCKTNEPGGSISTANERRNAAAMRDRIRSYCAANNLPVIDCGELIAEFAQGADLQYLTRGTTGDRTHPNQVLAQIYAIGFQRVLAPLVNPLPKYLRPDFAGTLLTPNPYMLGTAGTRGTNADPAAAVPDSWTLSASGTLTTANSIKADYNVGGENVFVQMISTGVSTGGGSGLNSGAPVPALNTTALHQLIADFTIVETIGSDHVVQYRRDGGNFTSVPNTASTDLRPTATAAGRPDSWSLMKGRRLVVASFPSVLPAAAQRTLFRIGAGNGLVGAGSSAKTYVAFASLVQYADPAEGYVA